MKVHEVMSTSLKTATKKTPFRELWKAIFQLHIHGIPVLDAKAKVIGIIAEEDLVKPLYPNHVEFVEDFVTISNFEEMEEKVHDLVGLSAGDVMNPQVIFTRPDTPILRALSRMIVRNVRQLPVITDEGKLVGLISKGDVFDSLFRQHLRSRDIAEHRTPAPRKTIVRSRLKKSRKK